MTELAVGRFTSWVWVAPAGGSGVRRLLVVGFEQFEGGDVGDSEDERTVQDPVEPVR